MRYGTIHVEKTKALISFVVTAKLICVFVFAYAKIRFSHVAAHMISIRIVSTYDLLKKLSLLLFASSSYQPQIAPIFTIC